MKPKETEEEAIERRKKMYGCDGKCYCDAIWDGEQKCFVQGQPCGGIDTCDETRRGECAGSCLAFLVIIGTPWVIILVGFLLFLGGR